MTVQVPTINDTAYELTVTTDVGTTTGMTLAFHTNNDLLPPGGSSPTTKPAVCRLPSLKGKTSPRREGR